MDDRPLRAALGRLGDTPQPPSAVDLDLARAQGRKRMRWRRAGLVAGPALAAALVTALAAAGVFGRIGTHGGLPSAHASKIKGILIGVSCPVPSRCVAVGEYYKPGPRYALIEQWNGIRWAISKGPVPPGPYRGDLYGISCVNAADCTAVGASVGNPPQPTATPIRDRALIEHWNGSAWTIMASPVLPASGSLGEISCTGPSRCIAVGMTGGGTAQRTRTLVERRNGSRWVIVPSPNPAGAAYSSLSSVSCTGPVNCMAVGEYFPGGQEQDRNHILVEHWNGSAWTITDAGPPPAGSLTSYLSAVSCTAESDCVAVGTASYPHRKGGSWGGSRERTLIEHWNGSAWSIIASPDRAGPPADRLAGVACITAADCTAVGSAARRVPAGATDGGRTLIEHWNGSAWSVVSSPGSSANSGLSQVACPATADCIAVGGFGGLDNPHGPKALIEHWNGSAWSIWPPPARPASR